VLDGRKREAGRPGWGESSSTNWCDSWRCWRFTGIRAGHAAFLSSARVREDIRRQLARLVRVRRKFGQGPSRTKSAAFSRSLPVSTSSRIVGVPWRIASAGGHAAGLGDQQVSAARMYDTISWWGSSPDLQRHLRRQVLPELGERSLMSGICAADGDDLKRGHGKGGRRSQHGGIVAGALLAASEQQGGRVRSRPRRASAIWSPPGSSLRCARHPAGDNPVRGGTPAASQRDSSSAWAERCSRSASRCAEVSLKKSVCSQPILVFGSSFRFPQRPPSTCADP